MRAGWGILDVSGGVLLKRSAAGVTAVVVPAPSDPAARPPTGLDPIARDGWEIVPGERSGDWVFRPAGAEPTRPDRLSTGRATP